MKIDRLFYEYSSHSKDKEYDGPHIQTWEELGISCEIETIYKF
jgi:hypothetical protein